MKNYYAYNNSCRNLVGRDGMVSSADPRHEPLPLVEETASGAVSSPRLEAIPEVDEGRTGVRYDLRVLRAIRRIIRCVDLYSKQLESQSDITAPQLVCLLAVVNGGPMTATALAKEVHLSPSTVVGILDRLEEKGLVTRSRGVQDRRIVRVSATERGAALAAQAPSPLQERLAQGLNRLPELEQAAIALALERVVQLMEAQHIDSAPILETGPLSRP